MSTTMNREQVEQYYTNLFTAEGRWAIPYPNIDEASRWAKISEYLSELADLRRAAGARAPLRMLDVGCGRGWLTHLASSYGECEGVEPVPAPVEQARTYFPALNFRVGTTSDVLAAPEFRPYDVVLSSEVIEHVTDKETFVAEIARCLRPGGEVLLTTPRGEEYDKYLRVSPRETMQPVEEWISEEDLRALFVRHGFRAVKHDRAYVHLPGMSALHTFCARFDASRKLDRLRLKWLVRGLQYAAAIYQVWWFRLEDREGRAR
ncbi:MAG TPA: methyltransferase domain-containing protein [Pyrinomonadaceae bacterium]|nr:methyltransferase domain-containing protein [Pyrinomonadaceae bacterium]